MIYFSSLSTLILTSKTDDTEDKGTEWTKTCCVKMKKPFIVCDPSNKISKKEIIEWLHTANPITLNIAGSSEKISPGVYKVAKDVIKEVLTSFSKDYN